jgi:COMPASS component SWD3
MADIFLSYRNIPTERAYVERLAAILEAHGFDVWWDFGLEAGETYRSQILSELTSAAVVCPLWSEESVKSRWVLMEAEFGKDKLLPARLQNIRPPDDFEGIHAANLVAWDGRIEDENLQKFIESIRAKVELAPSRAKSSLLRTLAQLPHLPPLPKPKPPPTSPRLTEHVAPEFGATLVHKLRGHPTVTRTKAVKFLWSHIDGEKYEQAPRIYSAAFSPDGSELLSHAENSAIIWDVVTGELKRKVQLSRDSGWDGAAYSPDGRFFARKSEVFSGSIVTIYSAETMEVHRALGKHSGPRHLWEPLHIAFSPDGATILATTYQEGETPSVVVERAVLDIQSGHEVDRIDSYRIGCFDPSGHLVLATTSGKIDVRDLKTRKTVSSFQTETRDPCTVIVSPDGSQLLIAGLNSPRVFDLNTGAHEFTLSGFTQRVWSVAYSPDSRYMFVASDDHTVKVMRAENGEHVFTFGDHGGPVRCVAVSPDGSRVATACDDGTIRVWRIASP